MMTENFKMKLIYSNQIQNFVDNPFYLYDENDISDDAIKNIQCYLRKRGVAVPKISNAESRTKDVIKMMYLAWASLESLDLMCALLGEEE
jgi:hypothetical protein